jgi:hypothetical protein
MTKKLSAHNLLVANQRNFRRYSMAVRTAQGRRSATARTPGEPVASLYPLAHVCLRNSLRPKTLFAGPDPRMKWSVGNGLGTSLDLALGHLQKQKEGSMAMHVEKWMLAKLRIHSGPVNRAIQMERELESEL